MRAAVAQVFGNSPCTSFSCVARSSATSYASVNTNPSWADLAPRVIRRVATWSADRCATTSHGRALSRNEQGISFDNFAGDSELAVGCEFAGQFDNGSSDLRINAAPEQRPVVRNRLQRSLTGTRWNSQLLPESRVSTRQKIAITKVKRYQ